MTDDWPGDCAACDDGRCDLCSGVTIEGMPCECDDAGHFGNLDFDEYDDEGDGVTA